jgi:hypothetical protein
VKSELFRQKIGKPPSAAQLTGIWVTDVDATLDQIEG